MESKTLRTTLREGFEEDSTGRGSGSRICFIAAGVTLCLALVLCICLQAFRPTTGRDLEGIIKCLIFALTGGGAGPYTIKQVFGKFPWIPDNKEEPPHE